MESTINRVREMIKGSQKGKTLRYASRKKETPKIIDFTTYVQMVEKKAYELFENRGCEHGHDVEDWQAAEAEVNALIGKVQSTTKQWLDAEAEQNAVDASQPKKSRKKVRA